MGTDIYLKWDGQTKAEEQKQYTGYSIDAGAVGYLRASIGMVKENAVLREVFPSEVWQKTTAYDFKANFCVLNTIAKKYLSSAMFGIPIEVGNGQRKQLEMMQTLGLFLTKKANFDKIQVPTNDGDIESEVMWINSLYQFFRLGLEKQKAGLNPKVYISW